MQPPKGLLPTGDKRVCKLKKSLYGLKQASRNWFAKLKETLLHIGFKQSRADYSPFSYKVGNDTTYLLVYVDDIIISGNNSSIINNIKISPNLILRIWASSNIFLVPSKWNPSESTQIYTRPLNKIWSAWNQTIHNSHGKESELSEWRFTFFGWSNFLSQIGRLIYLTITRVDITFAVNSLSQYMTNPRQSHMDAAMKILRYLNPLDEGYYTNLTISSH